MENIPHLLHTCVINNDEVIEAFSLYYTTHPQPFPFHESVPGCFRKFYQLGSRRTRPTLQNLDQEFLQFHKNEKVQRKIETRRDNLAVWTTIEGCLRRPMQVPGISLSTLVIG